MFNFFFAILKNPFFRDVGLRQPGIIDQVHPVAKPPGLSVVKGELIPFLFSASAVMATVYGK
jgi:hypothetical protein